MTSPDRPFSPPDDTSAAVAQWTLAPQADPDELFRLQAFLMTHRDRAIRIDAAALRRPDTLLLQLLIAACRDWAARGLPFQLADTPDRVTGLLPLLGLAPDLIGIEAR